MFTADEGLIELLLKHGADPNIKTEENKSSWDLADEKRNYKNFRNFSTLTKVFPIWGNFKAF